MSATAGPLLRISGIDGLAIAGLWLVAATGGIVFREPAPYDALLAVVMGGFLVAGLRVPRGIAPLALLMTLFVVGDFIGSARTKDIAAASMHSWVTLYLAISSVFFACVAAWQPERTVIAIVSGTLLAALVATVAGIAGYFSLLPGSEDLFTLYGRARGTFKDPNVFGPFLILPLLFAAARIFTSRAFGAVVWSAIAAVLLIGLFLSFSRGAWMHFAVSASVFVLMILTTVRDRGLARRATLLTILAVFVLAAGFALALSYDRVADLLAERAVVAQSYDQGVHGRFAGQAKALGVIIAEPLGIGFGEFIRYHPEQPHNVYLNTFLNAGWIGGFAYLIAIVATLGRAITMALRSGAMQPVAIALGATFAGLVVEGFVVDTDHWRHFVLIMGLIWGTAAASDAGRLAKPSRAPGP